MNKVQVLDCTLRDGGYCNQWKFGFNNICAITSGLVNANIDIIECGFLTQKVSYDENISKFTTVQELSAVIPANRRGKLFVAMMNFGEYDVEKLPYYDGSSIDGIRVAFHKKDLVAALELCRKIKEKGYQVFIQAMVSLNYTDIEFMDLIRRSNEIEPYAFYIVDSFGMMKKKDLIRLFYMVEHNLVSGTWIGFHSHNNMQLAYSNAQSLVDVQTNRNLIIDSSIYGMGRGAGNLNTELFVEYLNENCEKAYEIKPLLTIIDEILNDFYQRNYWGYSLPNYLSASYHTHPNYAMYLDDKKTLTVENMAEIFAMMDDSRRVEFDKRYIEELYVRYMATGCVQEAHKTELKKHIKGKTVLLIAPGRSSVDEKDSILSFINEDVVTVAVNSDYTYADTDYIFLSNLRRFRELPEDKRGKCIVTSNIPADGVYLQTKYSELMNDTAMVQDNAGMMAIKFLIEYGAEKVYLAGFDGYSHDVRENYANDHVGYITKNAVLDSMNEGMIKVLKEYRDRIDIRYLTKPRFIEMV